jgi:hypothetical protein
MRSTALRLSSPEDLAAHVRGRGPLYALLDAARSPAVLARIESSGEVFESLYAGRRREQLASVAPYLVQVSPSGSLITMGASPPNPRSGLLAALAREGWGRSWGFVVAARVPFAELRRHFRRFLTVETEEGEALSFRFYDPRVLRPFLASATDGERHAFFGPASAFFVEDRDPDTLLCFERVGPAAPAPAPPWDLPRVRDAQLEVFTRALADEITLEQQRNRLARRARWHAAQRSRAQP